MDDHLKALGIKSVMTIAILYLVLGVFYGISFGNILLLTVILGSVAYFIGDLLIFPKTNNLVATLSDFGLTFLLIWLLAGMTIENALMAAVVSSLALAAGEWFFHKYMEDKVLEEPDRHLYNV
ncbi:YndM family protein [Bacillus marinisedimentorum]|uniref:YndM family protein n=1 Tax=Bacillus marinisedimentorum TaxID=1821260 RepID=UPI000B1F649F|nr:YndM family protein [Bacillus marinisedimentorum]